MTLLNTIHSRETLLQLTPEQQKQLCREIREFLVEHISRTGGHLASNLGVVELTLALHLVFDTAQDRIVFDVGHQAYVHKILTGRQEQFRQLRTFGGIAGFPKPSESEHDAFIAGHASNAVSVALGMARARTLQKQDYSVIALLGDGALTGGLAYEGLNDAGASGEPLIVILNDNGMSITPNVGGISRHLKLIRTKPGYLGIKMAYRKFTRAIPGGNVLYRATHRLKAFLKRHLIGITLFEDMGFNYIGPVDGSNVRRLTELLRYAREMQEPVLLHVITKKGSGYGPAEEKPDQFHGVGAFDTASGATQPSKSVTFSATFGNTMQELAAEDPRICAITAAMKPGTGLDGFAAAYPDRFFDVGIAEGHAVAMAAGLAKQGMIPVAAIYSTFLQRAFDMMLHDVGLLNLHVIFAVDRAGLVGEDGETHHGVFDVGYLQQVPGMQILCPANQAELRTLLRKAALEMTGPVAVRYPRGGDGFLKSVCTEPCLREGDRYYIGVLRHHDQYGAGGGGIAETAGHPCGSGQADPDQAPGHDAGAGIGAQNGQTLCGGGDGRRRMSGQSVVCPPGTGGHCRCGRQEKFWGFLCDPWHGGQAVRDHGPGLCRSAGGNPGGTGP